jgi:dihydrofolate synthase/folylpolyglutamate synthase
MIYAEDELALQRKDYSLQNQAFEVQTLKEESVDLDWMGKEFVLPLLGDHQLDNARTALVCVRELEKRGYSISYESIYAGLKELKWPGRFEVISRKPLIIIDGAHNRDSFQKLKDALDLYLAGKKIIFIFGASEDKEVERMLATIQPSIDRLIVTQAQHPRAFESDILLERAKTLGFECDAAKTVEESIELAVKYYTNESVIIAAGSIFIAGAVREIWQSQIERKR